MKNIYKGCLSLWDRHNGWELAIVLLGRYPRMEIDLLLAGTTQECQINDMPFGLPVVGQAI